MKITKLIVDKTSRTCWDAPKLLSFKKIAPFYALVEKKNLLLCLLEIKQLVKSGNFKSNFWSLPTNVLGNLILSRQHFHVDLDQGFIEYDIFQSQMGIQAHNLYTAN